MKLSHTALLGAAMALSLPLALPAFAQTSDQSAYQEQQTSNQPAYQQQQMTRTSSHSQWQGAETIQAKVKTVDHDDNTVTINTQNDNELKVHYPSSTLQKLNEGDQVTVQFAYTTGNAMKNGMNGQYSSNTQSGNAMTGGVMAGTGTGTETGQTAMNNGISGNWDSVHTMPATVQEINKDNGTVQIESEGKQLTVAFAPSALQQLSQGQHIKVRYAIRTASAAGGNTSSY